MQATKQKSNAPSLTSTKTGFLFTSLKKILPESRAAEPDRTNRAQLKNTVSDIFHGTTDGAIFFGGIYLATQPGIPKTIAGILMAIGGAERFYKTNSQKNGEWWQ